jgi:hypothetical protein
MIRRPTRLVPALLLCTGFGIMVAGANSFLGLTTRELAGTDNPVLSCDTDGVSIAFVNAYDALSQRYRTTGATVSGIGPGCVSASISVSLRDASGASLGSGTASVTAAAVTVPLSPAPITEDLVGAAVVLNGP